MSSLTFVTETAVSVINSINSHAYMSPHKAEKAIQLIVLLVEDLGLNGIRTLQINSLIDQLVIKCILKRENRNSFEF